MMFDFITETVFPLGYLVTFKLDSGRGYGIRKDKSFDDISYCNWWWNFVSDKQISVHSGGFMAYYLKWWHFHDIINRPAEKLNLLLQGVRQNAASCLVTVVGTSILLTIYFTNHFTFENEQSDDEIDGFLIFKCVVVNSVNECLPVC